MSITLMEHQSVTADFLAGHPRALNTSSPGTGKTISSVAAYKLCPDDERGRCLVAAPLSILDAAWKADIEKLLGDDASCAVAHGTPAKRMKAFDSGAEIVIINLDGVKWIQDNIHLGILDGFSHFIVDEFTAYKNRSSQRTKAAIAVANSIPHLWMLSGTPNTNTVLDLWAPMMMLDRGDRLGNNFFRFRNNVCMPKVIAGVAGAVAWTDKPDAEAIVSTLMSDVTIRYTAEECLDLPPNRISEYFVELPKPIRILYDKLEKDASLMMGGGKINAIHAGAKVKKMLQLLSGAVYGDVSDEPGIVKVHSERYNLVMDLVEERQQCVIAYNWKHELDALMALAKKRKLSFGVINGSVSAKNRLAVVDAFQAGDLRIVFAHPQAAGHGLTLTAGTTTIWTSPTYNAEHYIQLNARIDRKGQTLPTETIHIAAKDTREMEVYEKLGNKVARVEDLLALFASLKLAA